MQCRDASFTRAALLTIEDILELPSNSVEIYDIVINEVGRRILLSHPTVNYEYSFSMTSSMSSFNVLSSLESAKRDSSFENSLTRYSGIPGISVTGYFISGPEYKKGEAINFDIFHGHNKKTATELFTS